MGEHVTPTEHWKPERPERLTDDAVREHARTRPDRLATVGPSGSLTWQELDRAADRFAGRLAAMGLGIGARIAWLGANDPGYLIALLGAWRRRAALVGLNWRLPTERVVDLARVVDLDLVVAGPGFEDGAAAIEGAGVAKSLAGPLATPQDEVVPAEPLTPEPADEGLVLFTSGSTGMPKAVPLSRAAYGLATAMPTPLGITSESQLLIVPPLFHLAGALWAQYGLFFGATQHYTDDATPAGLVDLITDRRITHTVFVPALISAVVDEVGSSGRAVPSLEYIAYGASPITPTLLRRAIETLGCRFMQVYGMTEAGGMVSILPHEEHQLEGELSHRLESAGRPIPGVEVRIRALVDQREMPTGEPGELWFRTPSMTTGYIGNDQATGEVLIDGWLRTRDVGYVDEDGFVYVQGRSDDMIITGGENVHPGQVENVIDQLDAVLECAVYGVEDEHWGQRVCAAVVARDEGLTEEDIREHCGGQLAGYQVPKTITFVAALPRTATGKVLRTKLSDEAPADRRSVHDAG